MKKIILTGIKPSGTLHLGNYFGAMQPAIEMQEQYQAVYFIADYHALTTVTKADELRRDAFDIAAGFLACGLDPKRTILFRQSDVPQVHELAWLLSVVTPPACSSVLMPTRTRSPAVRKPTAAFSFIRC